MSNVVLLFDCCISWQRVQMGLKDGRLKLMNQILSGVKVSFVCPVLVISCY